MITAQAAVSFICSYICCTLFWFLAGFENRTKRENLLFISVCIYFLGSIGVMFLLRWFLFDYLFLPSFLESPFLFLSSLAITYPVYNVLENNVIESEDSDND